MSRFRKEAQWIGILVLAASAQASPLGLKFNNNFNLTGDGNSLNANLSAGQVTQWENAIINVESLFSNLFSNSITINLTIDAAPGTSVLGESSTALTGPLSYSEVQTTLADDATSGDDNSVVANLPAIDPTGGGHFLLSTAQAKALGISGPSANTDGTVTFGAGWTYTYDPNNRAVAGEFDFIGVAAHEISEVMGRFGLLGTALDGSPDYTILDLLGYSSSGTISLVRNANGAYFSVDGGVTSLKVFNDAANGGDAKDWASGTNDSFNAFGTTSVQNNVTPVDVRLMDSIGYDLASPEPSAVAPFLAIAAAVLVFRRRLKLC